MSDAAGIFAGGWIEYAATRMGVPVPDLTRQEEDTFRVRQKIYPSIEHFLRLDHRKMEVK